MELLAPATDLTQALHCESPGGGRGVGRVALDFARPPVPPHTGGSAANDAAAARVDSLLKKASVVSAPFPLLM